MCCCGGSRRWAARGRPRLRPPPRLCWLALVARRRGSITGRGVRRGRRHGRRHGRTGPGDPSPLPSSAGRAPRAARAGTTPQNARAGTTPQNALAGKTPQNRTARKTPRHGPAWTTQRNTRAGKTPWDTSATASPLGMRAPAKRPGWTASACRPRPGPHARPPTTGLRQHRLRPTRPARRPVPPHDSSDPLPATTPASSTLDGHHPSRTASSWWTPLPHTEHSNHILRTRSHTPTTTLRNHPYRHRRPRSW
jgi:hypothetical protein